MTLRWLLLPLAVGSFSFFSCGPALTLPDAGPCEACESLDSGVPPRKVTPPIELTVSDAGAGDAGAPDAGPVVNAFPSLSDYVRCERDLDCPIGLGECVKSVPFNRADAVKGTSISLSAIDLRIGLGQGVCSRVCTTDESACDALALKDADGVQKAFTCQVIAVGQAPYPSPAPAFPFGDQLNLDELAAGQPFAALCRPPFELHDDVPDDACGACDGTRACSGLCFDFLAGAPRAADGGAGTCLPPAGDAGCAFGFEARTFDAGTFCAPLLDTPECGGCVDRDDDGVGTGLCTLSSYDCDDRNGNAYYAARTPAHPFPTFCGAFDYNCNGLSDEAEQVGNATYLANHCEFCGDDKHGKTVNPGAATQATLACVNGTMQVQTCGTSGRIHCAGDVRVTGCEATPVDGGVTWYKDDDGDGYGDSNDTSLGCPGGGAPSGYVGVSGDCNDDDAAIHPGQRDTCDCWGTCATAGARLDNDCDGQTDEDVLAYKWHTDADGDGAPSAAVAGGATYCGAPISGSIVPQPASVSVATDCNDSDAAMTSGHYRVVDSTYALVRLPFAAAPARDSLGNLRLLYVGASQEICDLKDNDCNGTVDNGVQTVFYRDADNDGWGLSGSTATSACAAPTGYVTRSGDCQDDAGTFYPGATESCDGLDQDCNGVNDNGAALDGGCTTTLPGICASGRQTACTNGAYVCTAWRTAETFDDPKSDTDVDEDCDGTENVVYVDATGTDGNSGLVPNLPVATIARGITVAQSNGRSQVWIAGGSYTVTRLDVSQGIDLIGGFTRSGNTYTHTGNATSILQEGGVSYDNKAVAVLAQNIGSPTTLAHLNIQVRDPSDAGVTTVGVYAIDSSSLQLRDVIINVAAGSAGVAGTNGTDGASGPSGGGSLGGAHFCNGTRVSGGDGNLTNGGAGYGDFGGAQVTYNTNGNDGATSSSAITGGIVAEGPPFTISKSGDGSGGYNGSGGSGGGPFNISGFYRGGGGGAGGCAGTGGKGGYHGGSSIGLLLLRSPGVQLGSERAADKVSITVNGGGAGGKGGNGGNGGNGGAGVYFNSTLGKKGGNGSGGRPGGGGAGGAGGWNVAILSSGSSQASHDWCTLTYDPTRVDPYTQGAAGTGGAAGSSGTGGLSGSGSGRVASASGGGTGLGGTSGFCVWKSY